MAVDALVQIQAPVTKTATFSGAALDVVTRAPYHFNLWCRVLYSAASNASGSNTVTFTIDGSADNVNFTTIGGARFTDIVTLSTTVQAGELFIPIQGINLTRYFRLTATFAGAGTTPTVTYQGDLVFGEPA